MGTASCDITISYDGAVVSQADSSASCSVAWAKKSALNFAKTLSFTMGDASADFFTADVSLTLTKAKNKAPSAVKTSIDSITTSPLAADPEFYPASLWCPQEDYLIWGQGAFESVVDEAAATGYEECAQRCAEFTNEAKFSLLLLDDEQQCRRSPWFARRQLQAARLHECVGHCLPWGAVRLPQMLECCPNPEPMMDHIHTYILTFFFKRNAQQLDSYSSYLQSFLILCILKSQVFHFLHKTFLPSVQIFDVFPVFSILTFSHKYCNP